MPAASSGVEIGCASNASSVPVSCSSRSRRESPSTDGLEHDGERDPDRREREVVRRPVQVRGRRRA